MRTLKSSLHHYKIERLVGEGQHSRVYKAIQYDHRTGLKNCVALKVLKSKHRVQQWKAEFNTLAQVRSLYCVRVLAWEWLQSHPALVLEYVDGPSLDCLQTYLSPACVYEVLRQVQLGLDDLRQHNLCHGDLSLHNIMINSKGQVRLVDFGLANRKFQHLTPEFAAPELLKGQFVNSQSDMYSVGRVAQTLLGRLSPVQKKTWLHPVPERRQWVPLTTSPLAQSSLRRAVHKWRDLQNSKTKTFTLSSTTTHFNWPALKAKFNLKAFGARWVKILGVQVRDFFLKLVYVGAQWVKILGPQARWQVGLRVLGLVGVMLMPSLPTQNLAWLQIQGTRWKHIAVNGKNLGYAPVAFNLQPYVTYRIGITSHKGFEHKSIRLHPDEVRVINDD